jgi:hypothetical protein
MNRQQELTERVENAIDLAGRFDVLGSTFLGSAIDVGFLYQALDGVSDEQYDPFEAQLHQYSLKDEDVIVKVWTEDFVNWLEMQAVAYTDWREEEL